MTRAPAALVAVLALSGIRTSGAAPCSPRAELSGDRDAVVRVAVELERLGITVASGTAGCPAVQAIVELERGGAISVAVRGASHVSEGRVLSDPALAAAWIDSWARDDLEVASWAPPLSAPASAPAITAPAMSPLAMSPAGAPPGAPARDAATSPSPELLDRLAVSAAYELSWPGDGGSWSGGSASACVMVGTWCLGGRARGAFEAELATGATAAARNDLSVFAIASLPIALGEMTLAPELGVGVGRFATRRVEGCMPVAPPIGCDPNDPTCVMMPPKGCVGPDGTTPDSKTYVGDHFDQASYTPRALLALRIAVPLFAHVWLDGLASTTFSPFAHAAPYPPNMPGPNGNPVDVLLPGEPTSALQLGVGLRVGMP